MRVMTVVGARPQFVKCAVVSRQLRKSHEEILVHTGQHYDHGMSGLFFEQLSIPEPDINLGVGSGLHGEMTARMLEKIERLALDQSPDWLLVYGDTNSTMAAALVGAKLNVPVAHVEAGLRSFNRRMPEEVNRVVTDHVAKLLLCPTKNAVELLAKEGITKGVHNTGDVMFDSVLANLQTAQTTISSSDLLKSFGFDVAAPYAFATLHRQENTDDRKALRAILEGLSRTKLPVLLPLHPRTRKILEDEPQIGASVGENLTIVDPIGYLELLMVVASSSVVLTDSGGLQKEAFFLGVPCVTLREETEWVETVDVGANEVVGSNTSMIIDAAKRAVKKGRADQRVGPGPFGDGHAAEKIVACLEKGAP